MPILKIEKIPEDLAKLDGWRIEKAGLVKTGAPAGAPTLQFLLSHIAAEGNVVLQITPGVTFGFSGNVLCVNAGLNLTTTDAAKEQ